MPAVYGIPPGRVVQTPFNDYFIGPLKSIWTPLGGVNGAIDVLNTTDVPGQLRMKVNTTGNGVYGITKPMPPLPFTVTTRLVSWTLASNYVQAGILLTDAAGGSPGGGVRVFGPLFGGFGAGLNDMSASSWSNRGTSRSGVADANVVSVAPIQLRADVASSTVSYWYSLNDGGSWTSIYSGSTIGFTPARIGLCVAGNTAGGLAECYFNWITFS